MIPVCLAESNVAQLLLLLLHLCSTFLVTVIQCNFIHLSVMLLKQVGKDSGFVILVSALFSLEEAEVAGCLLIILLMLLISR